MSLKERIDLDEIILYDVISHPIMCSEFINNIDRSESEEDFEYTWYQKLFMGDFNHYVSMVAGRSVGKTLSITGMLTWLLVNNIFPSDYVVYSVPNRAQLEPVWNKLVREFRINSFLRNFLLSGKGINNSSHQLKLNNGAFLMCRIAGQSGDGANVVGLHDPFTVVDEAALYDWKTFQELQPTLNTWQAGHRLIVSGVPNGLREGNVLYFADQVNHNYSHHRISAYDNPRFTKEDEERAIKQYGGKESDEFAHFVLGKHGSPVFSIFDRKLMTIKPYPVYKLYIDGTKIGKVLNRYIEKLSMLPPLPKNRKDVIFGIDLGYNDPTVILVMYLDENGAFRFHARITLLHVSYNIQDRVIDWVDTKYKPFLLGVDEGNIGKSVIQRLQESDDFAHKDYHKKLIPINFSSSTVIGYNADGNEIKSRTKPLSVTVLQDYTLNGKIIYSSSDPDIYTELERMTYTKNPRTGDIAYKTLTTRGGKRGEDHNTAALLSGILAYHLENEMVFSKGKEKPKLFTPKWYVN